MGEEAERTAERSEPDADEASVYSGAELYDQPYVESDESPDESSASPSVTDARVRSVTHDAEADEIAIEVETLAGHRDELTVPVPADAALASVDDRLQQRLFAQGTDLASLEGELLQVEVVEDGSRLRLPGRPDGDDRSLVHRAVTGETWVFAESILAVVAALAVLPLLGVAGGAALFGAGEPGVLALAVVHLVAALGLLLRNVLVA